jgi:hypothetical protein
LAQVEQILPMAITQFLALLHLQVEVGELEEATQQKLVALVVVAVDTAEQMELEPQIKVLLVELVEMSVVLLEVEELEALV